MLLALKLILTLSTVLAVGLTDRADGTIRVCADRARNTFPVGAPEWDPIRKNIGALKLGSEQWLRFCLKNTPLTKKEITNLTGELVSTHTIYRFLTEGGALPHGIDSLIPLFSEPDHVIELKDFSSFGRWLDFHVRNNPWGWNASEIARRAGLGEGNINRLRHDKSGFSENMVRTLADVLDANRAEAYLAAGMLPIPFNFGNWLGEQLGSDEDNFTELSRSTDLPIKYFQEIITGTTYPRREMIMLIARGLGVSESLALNKAGYLPRRSLFGRWVKRQFQARYQKLSISGRFFDLSDERLNEIITQDAYPTRAEVIKIGSFFSNRDRALRAAEMTREPGPFVHWARQKLLTASELEEGDLMRKTGVTAKMIFQIKGPEDYVPPPEVVVAMAKYWKEDPGLWLKAAGYLPLRPLATRWNTKAA